MLFLTTYERQLLGALERGLVQQGRIFASALSADDGPIDRARVTGILEALQQRQEARIRVVGREGRLLGDSARQEVAPVKFTSSRKTEADSGQEAIPAYQTVLYRIASVPVRVVRALLSPPSPVSVASDYYDSGNYLNGPEIRAALADRYGAATRISDGQRSVTLYSAIPVRLSSGEVVGAVLVSQSTYRILQDLYQIRLDIFRVFLISIAAAGLISLFLSFTIARPIVRLRDEADAMLSARSEDPAPALRFSQLKRSDQIGDLARAFQLLTERLLHQIEISKSFAADVSHEFRNPLQSIRSAAEVLADSSSDDGSSPFARMILEETSRLEHLLGNVRDVALFDSEQSKPRRTGSPYELQKWFRAAADQWQSRYGSDRVSVVAGDEEGPTTVTVDPERLFRAIDNLVANAVSFSPPGKPVLVELRKDGKSALFRVRDSGPGIPAEHLERIFARFFTYRPANTETTKTHSGLGLAIARSIVTGMGGTIRGGNNSDVGALFEVWIPVAD